MSPSDLPWWAWLLSALICGVAARLLAYDSLGQEREGFFDGLGCMMLLIGIICAVVGLIRFVKWVWTS